MMKWIWFKIIMFSFRRLGEDDRLKVQYVLASILDDTMRMASHRKPEITIFAAEDKDKRILKYEELLFAVERKFPNEDRHETALRYIRETERQVLNNQDSDQCCGLPS